ncbi:MAG: T9SS type A sorting domain-containing protein [Bacteroidia bacterium]
MYNPSTNIWTWKSGASLFDDNGHHGIKCIPSVSNTPRARLENRCFWTDRTGNFWLYGGGRSGFSKRYNDLWMYNPITLEWTFVSGTMAINQKAVYGILGTPSPSNNPGGRGGNIGWYDSKNNFLFLFGGCVGTFLTPANDLWRYEIDCNCPQVSSGIPVANFSSDSVICQNSGINFNNSSINAISYQWIFNGAQTAASTLKNPTNIYYNIPGNFDVTLIACNCNTCDTIVFPNYIHVDSLPTVNLGVDTTLCQGDSITLDAGSGFDSYLWSDNSTNQFITISSQGIYAVQIISGACLVTDSIVVSTQSCSSPIAAFASADSTFCGSDCIDFLDLTQNNPVSWQWTFTGAQTIYSTNENPTNICYTIPGNYHVQLISCNQFGCDTISLLNFIHIDAMPQVNLGNDTLLCIGDSLLLDAGSGFTSYLWSDNSTNQSITISSQGIYSVQITSGACVANDTIVVATQVCSPLISVASSDTNFCEKHCIDFYDLSTNNPTSWQWFFPGADSLTSSLQNPTNICYNSYGSYDVTLIACNAFGCDTLHLTNFINCFQNPTDSIYQSNDTLFSLPAYSYQWYEVTNGIIAGATNQYFIPQQAGSYYCIATDSLGCAGSSGTIVITATNQISNFNFPISIVPNPFNSTISITFQKQNIKKASLTIKNVLGKTVFYKNADHINSNSKTSIDLSDLSNGIYFLEIVIDGVSVVKKIVKQ